MEHTHKFKFSNGDKVKEIITGQEGTITGTCFYLTGCNQYLIVRPHPNDEAPISSWYDEGRLELVEDNVVEEKEVQGEDPGCDIPPPIGIREA